MRSFIRVNGTHYYTSDYVRDNQRSYAIVKAISLGLLCIFIAFIIS